jgi:hypothetical protein
VRADGGGVGEGRVTLTALILWCVVVWMLLVLAVEWLVFA